MPSCLSLVKRETLQKWKDETDIKVIFYEFDDDDDDDDDALDFNSRIRSTSLSLFRTERQNDGEERFTDVPGIMRDGHAVLQLGFQGISSSNVDVFYIQRISLF